jgi:hypothetical protein
MRLFSDFPVQVDQSDYKEHSTCMCRAAHCYLFPSASPWIVAEYETRASVRTVENNKYRVYNKNNKPKQPHVY